MNKKIEKMLCGTYTSFGFSLFCGIAYFLLALTLVLSTTENGGLLLLFFFPLIICGAALIILKMIKQNNENNNSGANVKIFYLHILLFAISVVLAASVLV